MPAISRNSQSQYAPESALIPVFDWIDRELSDATKTEWTPKTNILLELRQNFKQLPQNRAIVSFYRTLPRLERSHFLLAYRIRQWISLNFEIEVSDPLNRVAPSTYSIPQLGKTLPRVKNTFFEHAPIALPLSDLRLTIQKVA